MKRLFYKRYSRKMLSGVEMIKMGVLDRLAVRYKGIYGQETADSLAAAIVNEVFCQKPADPLAKEFFSTNKHVIEREMTNLKYDDEMCKIITQAIRMKRIHTDTEFIPPKSQRILPGEITGVTRPILIKNRIFSSVIWYPLGRIKLVVFF
jgi:hypothetical protein